MHPDLGAGRSRRAILSAAAAGAAGLAVSALAAPGLVAATAGDPVGIDEDNPTAALTSLTQATADTGAFKATGNGSGTGLEGDSTSGAGVLGASGSGDGVLGTASAVHRAGVSGVSGDATGSSHADAAADLDAGVYGWSNVGANPSGVLGESASGTGVRGVATGGIGLWGVGGTGAEGDGTTVGGIFSGVFGVVGVGDPAAGGVGLWGHVGPNFGTVQPSAPTALFGAVESPAVAGLEALGAIRLPDRSGRKLIGKNHASVTVSVPGMRSSNVAIATLNANRSGRWVSAVVCGAGKITIYLNAKVTSATYASWLVLG